MSLMSETLLMFLFFCVLVYVKNKKNKKRSQIVPIFRYLFFNTEYRGAQLITLPITHPEKYTPTFSCLDWIDGAGQTPGKGCSHNPMERLHCGIVTPVMSLSFLQTVCPGKNCVERETSKESKDKLTNIC